MNPLKTNFFRLLSLIRTKFTKFKGDQAQTRQIDLYLSLNFSKEWRSAVLGNIEFGLKGGELRLEIENATMPLADRALGGSLQLFIEKEIYQEQASERQSALEGTYKKDAGGKVTTGNKKAEKTSEKFRITLCTVICEGSDESPGWSFEAQGVPPLMGSLRSEKLGTITVIDKLKPCYVTAAFVARKRDIYFTDSEGLYDIRRNGRATLDIWLAKRLMPKVGEYISLTKLQL